MSASSKANTGKLDITPTLTVAFAKDVAINKN